MIKVQGAAQFAEEFIIKSIWENHFPAGSILPSERELSEKIGVTRTTLREVLQRLARDGWLRIQHGKPTKVNNIWETANLNILETIARIDKETATFPQLIDNLLSARTAIAAIFIRRAFRKNPEQSKEILTFSDDIFEYSPIHFTEFDYHIFRGLAFASGNLIYGLIFNGLKGLYVRVGANYFSSLVAKKRAITFYRTLSGLIESRSYEKIEDCVYLYGKESGEIWRSLKIPHPDMV